MTKSIRRSEAAIEYRKLYKTALWQRLRKSQLAEHPLCVRHLDRGEVRAATVVNHKTPHYGDTTLFYDPDNLESLCAPCHDADVQSEERLGYSTRVGDDGWPLDIRHPTNRKNAH